MRTMMQRWLVLGLSMMTATALAFPAEAGGSCFAAPNTITFQPLPGPGTFTMFVDTGGTIMVRLPAGTESCEGTIANTDSIHVDIGNQPQTFRINMAGPGGEFPDGINWFVGLGDAGDTMAVLDGAGADEFWFYTFDDMGGPVPVVDLHGGDGLDVRMTGVERTTAIGKAARDEMFASGFVGPAGAFRLPLRLSGAGGNDTLVGGRKADRLGGGSGRDLLAGFGGDDFLNGGAGNRDFCDGERGRDRLRNCESGGD